MAGLPTPLPFGLGGAVAPSDVVWENTNIQYDVALGGIPFTLAISDDTPYDRATRDSERPQYDANTNPGEQTLSGWWLRSQSSFSLGAGQKFYEPADDTIAQTRFEDSYGVDVFTDPAQMELLPATAVAESGSGRTLVLGYDNAGTPMFLTANASTVKRNNGTSGTSATWGGSGTVLSMCDDGTNAYIANATSIYTMPLASGSGSASWNTGHASVVVGFVKQRLVAGIGNSVYELVGTGPGLPTALYSHPNTSWVWTGFAEGPNCIYAAGYAGSKGAVFKFTLDDQGSMPELTAGSVVAELPTGETVRSIFSYLGSYVAIGTNKGVRIAVTSTDGDLSYGPLSVETDNPVRCFTGRDRFVFAGVEDHLSGNSGLICIDLGGEVAPLRYAYSAHLVGGESGTVDAVTLFGNTDRLVFGNGSAYVESATDKMTSGWLTTSRIRYGTLEPKLFKRINIRAQAESDESVTIEQVDQYGAASTVGVFGSISDQFDDYDLVNADEQVHMQFRFVLTRGVSTGASPSMRGYQVKALTSSYPGEDLRVPVYVMDFLKDQAGNEFGWNGRAYETFVDLKELEESGNAFIFQDLRTGEQLDVTVQRVRLLQNTPAHGKSGFGGVAQLELRTL